jgi:hypothetical protein
MTSFHLTPGARQALSLWVGANGGSTASSSDKSSDKSDKGSDKKTDKKTDKKGTAGSTTGNDIGGDKNDGNGKKKNQTFSDSTLLTLVVIHINIICYALSYWINKPVEPFLSSELGGDALTFAGLTTLFNLMQISGGFLVGALVDLPGGGRTGMLVTLGGSALSYGILG